MKEECTVAATVTAAFVEAAVACSEREGNRMAPFRGGFVVLLEPLPVAASPRLWLPSVYNIVQAYSVLPNSLKAAYSVQEYSAQ